MERIRRTVLAMAFSALWPLSVNAQEAVGERPYEMVWADRTEDHFAPTVDFEDLEGWAVDAKDAVVELTRSREQQLWGKYVAKLVYRGEARRAEFTIRPPKPVPVATPFDCVTFWVYGNNWAFAPNPGTPMVRIRMLLQGADGQEVAVSMGSVRWKEWWVMQRKLTAQQIAVLKDGAHFVGIKIDNCHNESDRVIYLDNLACYQEPLPPLTFEPRRRRGVEMFPGQTVGTNTGPGRLPFPIREETILPDNLAPDFETTLVRDGSAYVFRYQGADGVLEYRYSPQRGDLGDVTAQWRGRGEAFRPLAAGGARFSVDGSARAVPAERTEVVECTQVGDTVASTCRLTLGGRAALVTYTFRLWQKSLVIDVKCLGGEVGQVAFGGAVGSDSPRLVTIPYLVGEASRPAALVMGPRSEPLFLMGLVDHYRTNCSRFWFSNRIGKEGVTYNGGALYLPKTDGKRNDCFERLFVTVSPRFEEILPNIPNPKSPWMHVAGERVWRAHGASNRERDYEFWSTVARYGMTKCAITDHETGWRDGGESFTFRTRTAPKKGGDESQVWYSREVQKLGFRYGIYNNYTDFAPVNEHWHPDLVGRHSDGNWMAAWPRCYSPKPARAVEYEAMLAPIIQRKFGLSTAYCDVHTAVAPWTRVDFDARVPGAGTMTQQFYCYGEIMLHQKKVWNGPVYSEGNNHWYYSGLTDGNYAQDQSAKLPVNPWLVDFDLRKMHPLNCNFGMGNPGMLYGRKVGMGSTMEERTQKLDRFLAATLAFGHTGFLVRAAGTRGMVRSYFMVQQAHKHYAQETAKSIRYGNGEGALLDVSAAVASGAHKRSQVATEYSNGMLVVVNGHPTEDWHYEDGRIDRVLPPNGYLAILPGDAAYKKPKLAVVSGRMRGHRIDYAETPAYVFADGRGQFTRFPLAATDGSMVANRLDRGRLEVIPVEECSEFGVSLSGQTAVARAFDKAREDLGPTPTRLSRGLVYVTAKDGAFSYVLAPAGLPKVVLTCERSDVVPGETVVVRGWEPHTLRIPPDTKPGTRSWHQLEGAWIDFNVLPIADVSLELAAPLSLAPKLHLALSSNLSSPADAELQFLGQRQRLRLAPGEEARLNFDVEHPSKEEVRAIPVRLAIGDVVHEEPFWLKAEEETFEFGRLVDGTEAGMCLRGGKEESIRGEAGAGVYPREMVCGNKSKNGIFMHPPYKEGVGYSYWTSREIPLPAHPPAAFRCSVGKGDGSDPGDGILFRVAVVEPEGKETIAAEKQWIKHAWTPLNADLSQWAGQTIRIKIITDVGPADDSVGDWACWSVPVIESRDSVLALTLYDTEPQLRYAPGPYPAEDLRVSDLRSAKKGWLHYQSVGLECSDRYRAEGEVCGINIGRLTPSKGSSEVRRSWGEEVALPLPSEVFAKLGRTNRFVLHNIDGDWFKVRRFWIEFELADGRKCSSKIETIAYTQPPNWLHAEGVGVNFGESITVDIVFDLSE